MKKQIVLASLLLAAGMASAAEPYATMLYKYDRLDSGVSDSGFAFTIGSKIDSNFAVDISGQGVSASNSAKTLSDRIEAGVTVSEKLGPVGVYVRGNFGDKMKTGANNNYYGIEPGVRLSVTDTDTLSLGWRFRTATDDNKLDTTRTTRVNYAHALSPKTDLVLEVDRQLGDGPQTTILAGAKFKF
jgi:hypothetical protein